MKEYKVKCFKYDYDGSKSNLSEVRRVREDTPNLLKEYWKIEVLNITEKLSCDKCRGTGHILPLWLAPPSYFNEEKCPNCKGLGVIVKIF
jgi:hypothetical protein